MMEKIATIDDLLDAGKQILQNVMDHEFSEARRLANGLTGNDQDSDLIDAKALEELPLCGIACVADDLVADLDARTDEDHLINAAIRDTAILLLQEIVSAERDMVDNWVEELLSPPVSAETLAALAELATEDAEHP